MFWACAREVEKFFEIFLDRSVSHGQPPHMAKPKLTKTWLKRLPDGYRERALANCDSPDDHVESLPYALISSFGWDDSPEGHDFWDGVYDWCRGESDSLPPLPDDKPADTLPDSGKRTVYETGAVRDASEGKGHFRSIPPVALRKLAERFEAGAKKYSDGNWRKGIPLSHYQDSTTRHLLAWAEGKTDEDHMGAVLWNAACAAWTEEAIRNGDLPEELDDLPFRSRSHNR